MNLHDLPLDQKREVDHLCGADEHKRFVKASTRGRRVQGNPDGSRTVQFGEKSCDDMAGGGVEVIVARTVDQLTAAQELVRARYASRGYRVDTDQTGPFPDAARAPHYVTFLAKEHGSVVGTLTLGMDSLAGLLVDDVNRDEVDAVRAQGRRVCELVRLAVATEADSKRVLPSLIQWAYALGQAVYHLTDVFIEVNPRHVVYYQRFFGFMAAGTEKLCSRVAAPSVLLRLETANLERRLRG